MQASKFSAVFMGFVGLGVGALGILAGLGYLPRGRGDESIPMAEQQAVAITIGVVFAAAGVSAMLQAFPSRAAGVLYRLLGLVIVIGLTSLFAWVALGAGSRDFSSPLAILGPRVNEISGRILFGLVALLGLTMAIVMVRRPGRRDPAIDA